MNTVRHWEDYLAERDAAESQESTPKIDKPLTRPSKVRSEAVAEQPSNTGKRLDEPYRDKDFDKKLQEFIKGRKNSSPPVVPPKEAPKGWFVVDEETRGFWAGEDWSHDTNLMKKNIIDSEKDAHSIAKLVNGVVLPAAEILG